MSTIGTSKGVLEIVKFGVYVSVPIGLMYLFANNNKNLQKIMGHREYVVYPTETVRPQSPEELRDMAKRNSPEEREGPSHAELRKMAQEIDAQPTKRRGIEEDVGLSVMLAERNSHRSFLFSQEMDVLTTCVFTNK